MRTLFHLNKTLKADLSAGFKDIFLTQTQHLNIISLFEIWLTQCYVYTQTKQYTPTTSAIPQKGLFF